MSSPEPEPSSLEFLPRQQRQTHFSDCFKKGLEFFQGLASFFRCGLGVLRCYEFWISQIWCIVFSGCATLLCLVFLRRAVELSESLFGKMLLSSGLHVRGQDIDVFVQTLVLCSVPVLFLSVLRLLSPGSLDKLFFVGTSTVSGERVSQACDLLRSRNSWNSKQTFSSLVKRNLQCAIFLSALFLSSWVPYLGFILVPGIKFMILRPVFGPAVSLLVVLVSLVPPFRAVAVLGLATWVTSRAIARELMFPYSSRATRPIDSYRRKGFFLQNDAQLTGFCFPLTALATWSPVGILFIGFGQAAMGAFATAVLHPLKPSPIPKAADTSPLLSDTQL
mmetsp:Transcript_7128/g.16288  ORF Transcript_7128/g.16288 Transcript_7128/m.16288 type:complete len:334 (-) Transcript_7128:649-1650(-)